MAFNLLEIIYNQCFKPPHAKLTSCEFEYSFRVQYSHITPQILRYPWISNFSVCVFQLKVNPANPFEHTNFFCHS